MRKNEEKFLSCPPEVKSLASPLTLFLSKILFLMYGNVNLKTPAFCYLVGKLICMFVLWDFSHKSQHCHEIHITHQHNDPRDSSEKLVKRS